MTHSDVISCIDCELLRFIRDTRPSESMLLDWLGAASARRYHVLRRAGLLVQSDGRVTLSPDHLSKDGSGFAYQNHIWEINRGTVMVVRRKRPPS